MSKMNRGKSKKKKPRPKAQKVFTIESQKKIHLFLRQGWRSRFKKHRENKIDWIRKKALEIIIVRTINLKNKERKLKSERKEIHYY